MSDRKDFLDLENIIEFGRVRCRRTKNPTTIDKQLTINQMTGYPPNHRLFHQQLNDHKPSTH